MWVALLAPGCGGPQPPPAEGVGAVEAGPEIPRADLGAVEEATRERVERLQAEIESLLALPRSAPGEVAEAYGRLGSAYLAYDFYRPAEACYRRAADLLPEDYRWRYLLGLTFQLAGDLPAAVRELEAAHGLRPDDLPTLLRLADALLELGDVDGAGRRYQEALGRAPDSAAARYGLGRIAARVGDVEAALEHLGEALELQPAASAIHYQLGQLYRRRGDLEKARRHLALRGDGSVSFPDPLAREVGLQKVTTAFQVVQELARDPESLSEQDLLGFAIVQFGDVRGALREFRRLLEEEGSGLEMEEQARVHYVLGALQAREGSHQEAVASYRAALERDPGFAAARVQLASSLSRIGRPEEALAEVDEVLAGAPGDTRALLKRASILTQIGRHREALADLERLVDLDPKSSEARLRLASLQQRLGRPGEAIGSYASALELAMEPADRSLAYFRLAELQRGQGAADEAIGSYRRALNLDDGFTAARMGLAAILAQTGSFGEAAEQYREVVAAEPENGPARLGEAGALILAGRYAEARERLEEGLERLPDEPALAQTLARHLAACPDPAIRDGGRAVELISRVVRERPTVENRETLAMALAEAGRYEQAAAEQERLVRAVEEGGGERTAAERLRANLERYRSGRPCCAAPPG